MKPTRPCRASTSHVFRRKKKKLQICLVSGRSVEIRQSPLVLATQAAINCWFSFSSSPVLAAIPQQPCLASGFGRQPKRPRYLSEAPPTSLTPFFSAWPAIFLWDGVNWTLAEPASSFRRPTKTALRRLHYRSYNGHTTPTLAAIAKLLL
jgi:hypothetical protein